MYRKVTIALGILFLGSVGLTLEAQTMSNTQLLPENEAHCKSIQDVVDRERCIAEAGIAFCKAQLKDTKLNSSTRKEVESIIYKQEQKIVRLNAMTAADRQKMQAHYDQAMKARSNR